MNNHLIPEQRFDKNGRLNTKHVRAVKPQTNTAKVPAPSLTAIKKKLTAAQTRPKPRTVAYSSPGNYELNQKLGTNHQATDIMITASDAEFYEVLSVTSRANAFALLQAGHRTAEEAINYLQDNGFEELLTDNSELCEEALTRRIPPNKFIEADANLRGPESSDYYFDALEVYSSVIPKGSGEYRNLVLTNKVYDGKLKLSDLKEVGFREIAAFKDKAALIGALEQINAGTADYTPSDLKALANKHPQTFRDALTITSKYGIDFTLSVNVAYFDHDHAAHLEAKGTDKTRSIELLRYRDQVSFKEYEHNVHFKKRVPYETLEKCYDLGLTPTQVATNDYTEQQLNALLQGATPGISSGWL